MASLFVACLEASLQLTNMGLMIAAEVLEKQVRDFYKKYEKECDLIKEISDLVEKLKLNNKCLIQLKQVDVYVVQNWSIL